MNKDIKYNGLTTTPSDNICQDGDSAMLLNLVPEDGALKPVLPAKTILELGENRTVMHIHKTTSFSNYIILNTKTNEISSIDVHKHSVEEMSSLGTFQDVLRVDSIGNTLLVFTENFIMYFIWKEGVYKKLGDHVPGLQLSFGLRGKPRLYSISDKNHSTFWVNFDKIDEGKLLEVWSDENQKKITSQVMAKVNKFLAEQTIKEGRFALPFFVRYALRLYDGSLICHSAPILMNPSTKSSPVIFWRRAKGKKGYTDAECDIMLVSASLDYQFLKDWDNDFSHIKDWKDIIKSVDVFISKPIYTYDQSGTCKSFNDTNNLDAKFIGALDISKFVDGFTSPDPGDFVSKPTRNKKEDCALLPININNEELTTDTPGGRENALGKNYVEWKYEQLYTLFFSEDGTFPATSINLPEYEDDKNKEALKNVQNFYFLYSIPLDDLSLEKRKDIVVDKEYLQSLTTREVMTDDYLSHDRLKAKYSQTYNGRINLSGIKRVLYRGFSPASMFAYANSYRPNFKISGGKTIIEFDAFATANLTIQILIEENGERYVVSSGTNVQLSPYTSFQMENGSYDKRSWGCYVFYPNTHATIMRISAAVDTFEIKLKPHDFLNGAYGVLDYELERKTNVTQVEGPSQSEPTIDVPSKIYTSEVNNPFFFPVTGINTIGTGRIFGIATAAKALSQGQFGQFPLYAFTDEGVWALSISSTGSYSAKQPITRDVCLSSKSITQIDSAVLFTTDRGIMLLEGSQATCISDILSGKSFLPIDRLVNINKILDHVNLSTGTLNIHPFLDFVKDARMIYDYEHQRIIVYNTNKEKNCNYAYVFSLKSKQWGMVQSNILSSVNSYPNAVAVSNDGKLVDFSIDAENIYNNIVISRPIKLDEQDIHKTIDTVIQRGIFRKGHVKSILYASNDLYNWVPVWSSVDHYLRGFRGTPYKYMRIILLTELSKDESITGCSVQFTPRLTNQPR